MQIAKWGGALKTRKAFTLVELLAVIVILAIIALISTPIILGIIDKARRGAFEDSAYGIFDAGRQYYIEQMVKPEGVGNQTIVFPKAEGLKFSGERPDGGFLEVNSDGYMYLYMYNEEYCAKGESTSNVEVYRKDSADCEMKIVADELLKDEKHIKKNVKVNGNIVDKVIGTRAEKNNMKNYVWYAGQLWQVLEIDEETKQMKMVTAQSMTSIAYGSSNDWNSSWAKKWLNERFLSSIEGGSLESGTFCHDTVNVTGNVITSDASATSSGNQILEVNGHTQIETCQNLTSEKVGLITFEDYAYALYGDQAEYKGGSFLNEDEFTWTMTPYTADGRNDQMWIEWYSNGYLSIKKNSSDWSKTNTYGHGIRPVVYVSSSVLAKSGNGTKKDPYVLVNEKVASSGSKIENVKVGDYVYLEESKNPNTFTSETIASGVSYSASKDNVRYRVVKKNADGSVKVERADVLRNLPNTVAISSKMYVPFYYHSGDCYYDGANDKWYTSGCTNHNIFSTEGSGNYEYQKSMNLGYFLNNGQNGFYTWYSDNTKKMIQKTNWNLVTGGYGKDYSNLDNNPSGSYPSRTNDGIVEAYVGLPSWGEMYSGNDLNTNYWLMNRWQGSSSYVSFVDAGGHATGNHTPNPWLAVRPVVTLKSNVLLSEGKGTMTEPYTLMIK